tara:strand:+ start:822 stop:935 length:114 start_codon:yes stop_codon:yes gene_type:complete
VSAVICRPSIDGNEIVSFSAAVSGFEKQQKVKTKYKT